MRILIACALIASASAALAQPAELDVRVESAPSGATVEVGGRSVGRTPIRRLRLPAGEHDFVFTRRGHARTVVHASVTEPGLVVTATLERAAILVVRADNLAARNARISVDGQAVGTVPTRLEIAPGRRLIEVDADGYLTFGQWIDAVAGETSTVNVRLEERPSDVGSLLVTTDVADAEVSIDGARRGRAPHLAHGLTPGQHRVEIVSGERRAERTVEVRADAREVVHFELEERPPETGSAQITTEPAGATVLVDGEPRGATPLTLEALTPGAHIVELTLEGYENQRRVVTIEPGVRAEVSAALTRGQPQPGRIVVRANRDDAFVQVDGLSRGRAPLTLENVQPGRHPVRVLVQGATPYESECVITSGETCTINALITGGPVRVRVNAVIEGEDAEGAVLFIDGAEVGALPWEGELEVGEHTLEARAPGSPPASHTIEIEAGMPVQTMSIALERNVEEPVEQPVEQPAPPRAPPSTAHFIARSGAEPLSSGHLAFSFFLGWPYLLGVELDTGLLGPFDMGLAVRTFGRVTEFEVHARGGARLANEVAIGGWVRASAAIGPDEINAFSGRLDARVSVLPAQDVIVSGWIGVDFSTDDYPYTEQDAARRLSGDVDRQDLVRARAGGAADFRFAPDWSLGVRFEGILASTASRRRLFGDVLELGNPDTELYGEVHAGVELD